MTNEMRELIYNYEDSDHFDIVAMLNEVYAEEESPCDELVSMIKLDLMIAECDDAPMAGENTAG